MATFEQIIAEARKLPVEEQRRLRAALELLDHNSEAEEATQELPIASLPATLENNWDSTSRPVYAFSLVR